MRFGQALTRPPPHTATAVCHGEEGGTPHQELALEMRCRRRRWYAVARNEAGAVVVGLPWRRAADGDDTATAVGRRHDWAQLPLSRPLPSGTGAAGHCRCYRGRPCCRHMDAATTAALPLPPPQPPGPFPPMLKPPITRGWGWLASPPLLVLARTCPVLMMQWGVGERRGRWRGGELAKVPCRHVEGRGSAACNDGSSEVELRRISRCRCVQWHHRRVVWRQ